ncbi:MAG: adenosine kinase [Actinomycetota bacterium]|nr:adenosine kinase [Actinomycetota bacterium]
MGADTGELDVLGIGNAIVDVLSHTADDVINSHGLPKGSMTLIDAERADALYRDIGESVQISGGSGANTIVGAASFGGDVAFVGKVRNDRLGEAFTSDIRAASVLFETSPLVDGPATARCLIMISPDGQRTMSTYLGAAVELGPEDIDTDLVGRAKVTYLEGYLWDPPRAKEAFRTAMAAAHARDRKVALTLSDSFCVERHREEFRVLVENDVDILFANEDEVKALYEVAALEEALALVRGRCAVVAVTRSEKGSLIFANGSSHEVEAEPVEHIVDTTGAGDSYAAGFLYGLTHGRELPVCGRLGSIAAAEIISHFGARPIVSLRELAAPALASH